MASNHVCMGACGRNITKGRTWCQWCRPVHIRRDNIQVIDDDPLHPDALRVVLTLGSEKTRVVYIHPGPAALIAQAIQARNWMPLKEAHSAR